MCDEPFGGVSVLAVGDLYQLPPVARCPVFKQYNNDPLANLYGSLWCKHFQLIQLEEIVRQKDDVQFVAALNRICINKPKESDILLNKSRQIEESSPQYPKYALHIFPTNKDVDSHNSQT
jgi:hypothetical protein